MIKSADPFRPTSLRVHSVPMLTSISRTHLHWLERRNLAASTIATRRRALTAIESVTARRPLEATREQLESMLDRMPHEPGTRNVWSSHIRSFYRWATDEGLIVASPARLLSTAEVDECLPRPIPEPALADAIAGADDQMLIWLLLAAYGGLRVSEISALRGENVSLELKTLRIERSKRGKSRVVPMHPRIVDAFPTSLPTGRIWHHSSNMVTVHIAKHIRRHGHNYTAHQLRHRFATQVYLATGDINVVRELLGHASTATTQIYTRVTAEHSRAAVALIA